MVERAKIVPPRSQVGAITPEQRKQIIASSSVCGHYEKAVDRESAFEKLQAKANAKSCCGRCALSHSGRFSSATSAGLFLRQNLPADIGPRGARHDSMAEPDGEKCMHAPPVARSAVNSSAASWADCSAAAGVVATSPLTAKLTIARRLFLFLRAHLLVFFRALGRLHFDFGSRHRVMNGDFVANLHLAARFRV